MFLYFFYVIILGIGKNSVLILISALNIASFRIFNALSFANLKLIRYPPIWPALKMISDNRSAIFLNSWSGSLIWGINMDLIFFITDKVIRYSGHQKSH